MNIFRYFKTWHFWKVPWLWGFYKNFFLSIWILKAKHYKVIIFYSMFRTKKKKDRWHGDRISWSLGNSFSSGSSASNGSPLFGVVHFGIIFKLCFSLHTRDSFQLETAFNPCFIIPSKISIQDDKLKITVFQIQTGKNPKLIKC